VGSAGDSADGGGQKLFDGRPAHDTRRYPLGRTRSRDVHSATSYPQVVDHRLRAGRSRASNVDRAIWGGHMVSIVEDEPIVSRDAYTVSYKPTTPKLPKGRAWARDDLELFGDDGCRYEIVDGTLIVSAAPGRLHQRAVGRPYRLLDDSCPPVMEVL